MRRMALAVNVELQFGAASDGGAISPAAGPMPKGMVVYSIDGPLFFGAAEKLERTLAHIQRPATTLVLRMGHVPFVDATGIAAIKEIVTDFNRHGAKVVLSEVRPNVLHKLTRSGLLDDIGADNVFATLPLAVAYAKLIDPS
jgi:SulP family sulfate permease